MAGARLGAAKPSRPTLSPLFASACLLWAACAASYSAGQARAGATCLDMALGALAAGAAAAAACLVAGRKPAALAAVAAAMGLALGFGQAAQLHALCDTLSASQVVDARLALVGDSRSAASGETAFADMELPDGSTVRVHADFSEAQPLLDGTCLRVTGTVALPDWGKDSYLWQNGAAARLHVKSGRVEDRAGPLRFLRELRAKAIDAIGSSDEGRALLQAVVCGYRHEVSSTSLYARFQACGLAHLVAVSGAHLVIVTGLFAAAFRRMRVPRRLSVVVLVAIMGAYLVFAGFPVSALRAALMATIGLSSLYGRRRPFAQNALAAGMFAIVAVSPSASVSVSFALSALSTAGIVLFAPLISSWLAGTPLARVPLAADALALTFSSGILSQLYACSVFKVLPLASPLANVLCAPVFPAVCAAGLAAAAAGCLLGPLASPIIGVASGLARMLGAVVDALASTPLSCVPVSIDAGPALAASAAMAFLLWAWWPKVTMRGCALAALAGCMLLAPLVAGTWQDAVIMLDVGQGDAFLVRSRGTTLLVDTGNRDAQLLDQLARQGVLKLDSVLLTHSDDDHVGSLDALERGVHVGSVIMARGIAESQSEKNRALVSQAWRVADSQVFVSAGDSFSVGAFEVAVLWPRELSADGGNEDSVCLLLSYDGDGDGQCDFKALLTGDAEREQVAQLMESGAVGDIDVLKVGHHGSRNGLDARQAEALKPEIALISVGAANRYGHPAPEVIDMLEQVGCSVFRTDVDGCVKCSFTADAIRVELQ